MSDTKQYCSFHVDELFFGIDVQLVQEVIRYQEMTQVPLACGEIGGLINLRGQIVTAVDLRRRLGLADRTDGKLPMNVVIRTADGSVSLLVDEIGDVLDLDASSYEPVPETLVGPARELVGGVYKLSKRLLLVLETHKTTDIAASERQPDPTTRIAA